MTEIIVAGIGLLGSGIGSIIGIFVNSKLVDYRLKQLEDKVNKHNNLIDRTYNLETQEKLLEEQLKVVNHRIKDIEGVQEKYSDNKFVREH